MLQTIFALQKAISHSILHNAAINHAFATKRKIPMFSGNLMR